MRIGIKPVQWIVASQAAHCTPENPLGFAEDFLRAGWYALDNRITNIRERGIERAIVQQMFGSTTKGDMKYDAWPLLKEVARAKPEDVSLKVLCDKSSLYRAVVPHIQTGFNLIGKIGTLRKTPLDALRTFRSTQPLDQLNMPVCFDSAGDEPWDSVTADILHERTRMNKTSYIEPWPKESHWQRYPAICMERFLKIPGTPNLEDAVHAKAERLLIISETDYRTPQALCDRANQLIELGITPVVGSTRIKFNGESMETV